MKFDPHFSETRPINTKEMAKKRWRMTFLSLIVALGAFVGINIYHGRENIIPLFLDKTKATTVHTGQFTLTDENGQKVDQSILKNHYSLVYFGFTFCPDICPVGLNKMVGAYQAMPEDIQKNLQLIFITIDPARDTPEVIKEYTNMFNPKLLGLTGTDKEIADITQNYMVYYAKRENKEDPEFYMMDHSAFIYLVGPEGQILRHFGHSLNIEEVISGLKKHLIP